MRLFTSWPCPPCAPPARPHTCPVLQPHPAPCSLRRAPCLWTCCSFCLEFPCPPGELLVLQDSTQNSTFEKTALPLPPALSMSPNPPGSPEQRISIPAGLFLTHGALRSSHVGLLHSQTELQGQGLSFIFASPAVPWALPTGGTRWMVCGRMGECGQRWV